MNNGTKLMELSFDVATIILKNMHEDSTKKVEI